MRLTPAVRRAVTSGVAVLLLGASQASGQESLALACPTSDQCQAVRVYSPTVCGQSSVRLLPPTGSHGKSRSIKLATVSGLYKEPGSGTLRLLGSGGVLAETVVPARLPKGAAANAWTLDYRRRSGDKAVESIPAIQFVALLKGPRLEATAVEFLKRELRSPAAHPARGPIVGAVLAFAASSPELHVWRAELNATMKRSLDQYTAESARPDLLEATLVDGVGALRTAEAVEPNPTDLELRRKLASEHRRMLERFTIAATLENAGLHDAFLEKLDQIGLARWSRPALVEQWEKALRDSAHFHHARAVQLLAAGQYAVAFDEARLASTRAPCNDEFSEFYYRTRVEFVHRNMVPALPEYANENRTILQQIVRELQSMARDSALTPERVQYVRKRIAEGERLDSSYLPLLLKKAEFLATIGELTASRAVVTAVERSVRLARTDAEEWLNMDASLNGNLVTLRQTTEKRLRDHIAAGEFKEALESALVGLRAEPENQRFLYFGAIAAAVLRDSDRARELVRRSLRASAVGCGDIASSRSKLLDLYARESSWNRASTADGKVPNWISGERYAPGEAFYDPLSGSFNGRVLSSVTVKGDNITGTEFRWEGYLAASIETSSGSSMGARLTQLQLEPVYDPQRVYMTGIGTKANSEGRRRVMPLRYLNSPDFDPLLAASFTEKLSTRGWAGNPFFHPFLFNDIFLFDLVYDASGRLKEAVPIAPDPSRPVSGYSERLTFEWEGRSKRLLAISGLRYRRDLTYDDSGRLVLEKIRHTAGRGRIEYFYRGKSKEPSRVTCEDDFYDRRQRSVILQSESR